VCGDAVEDEGIMESQAGSKALIKLPDVVEDDQAG